MIGLLLTYVLTFGKPANIIYSLPSPNEIFWSYLRGSGAAEITRANIVLKQLAHLKADEQIRLQLEFVDQCEKALRKNGGLPLSSDFLVSFDAARLDLIALANMKEPVLTMPRYANFIAPGDGSIAIRVTPQLKMLSHLKGGHGVTKSPNWVCNAIGYELARRYIKERYFVMGDK